MFLGGQPHPHPKGGGDPSVPNIIGTSYMCVHSMKNSNEILHGDQARCE